MRMEQTRAAADVDAAAQIWAEATAARDGEDEIADLADSRPIIEGVLSRSADSVLLLARSDDGVPLAFAAVEPVHDAEQRTAELSYLGVSPRLFGQGIGRELLSELRHVLRARHYYSKTVSN